MKPKRVWLTWRKSCPRSLSTFFQALVAVGFRSGFIFPTWAVEIACSFPFFTETSVIWGELGFLYDHGLVWVMVVFVLCRSGKSLGIHVNVRKAGIRYPLLLASLG